MLEHKKIQSLGDYFVDLNSRQNKGVYFYRINGYSEEISEFIKKYYDVARRTGVVIEGKIPNPDEKNLAYYGEIMGMNFQMSIEFISTSLKKWLPRMNDFQRQNVSASIYDSLDTMRKAGKTENMLKMHTSSLCAGFIISLNVLLTNWGRTTSLKYYMKAMSVIMN